MKKTIALIAIGILLAFILGCVQDNLERDLEDPVYTEEPASEAPETAEPTPSEPSEPSDQPETEPEMPEPPAQKLLPGEEEPTDAADLPYVQVSIDKSGFEPKEVVVKKGTTVVFTNEVNRMSSLQIYTLGNGYKTINSSGRLLENDSFNHTFDESGDFGLREIILNFRGSITVE